MLKRIPVNQLSLGMHLQAFCGAWLEHPFWRTKFVLSDPNDLILIRESTITEVWIDVSKGLDIEATDAEQIVAVEAIPEPAPVVQEKSSFNDEVKRAAKICAKGKEAVVSMFQEARMGKAIEAEAAAPLVEEISNSVLRNPGALISLARLKIADDYTYMHSVAVCALMIALSRKLGLDEQQTREAGMAGLLHDLGKAMIPMEILNKPGKLTEEEFTLVKTHPEEGHKLLLGGKGISDITKDVCLHHYEKIDGSGYPKGLNGETMSLFAKMGAVCDVYDAITSNRPYKAGWDPAESIKRMAEWKGHFDPFPGFRQKSGDLPGWLAGQAGIRKVGRRCRAGRTVAAQAQGQGLLLNEIAGLHQSRVDRHRAQPGENRRPRRCGEVGDQGYRPLLGRRQNLKTVL